MNSVEGIPEKVGTLESFPNERYIFAYEQEWISKGFALDSKLDLINTPFMLNDLPLFLLDSSPDSWGRRILDKRAESKNKRITDVDYALGVDDEFRMGALRISNEENESLFLDPLRHVPNLVDLVTLENACNRVQNLTETNDDLFQLFGPGTSMGGARPKAMVKDNDVLYMAKFKSTMDYYRVSCWEATSLKLSKMAGLSTNDFRLLGEHTQNPVILIKRFDREVNKRIHFASLLTLGHFQNIENVSYAEIGSIIRAISATPNIDTYEWWKRMVFNGLIGNTDDHLRNHGFLRKPEGWRLSPAYDINPVPFPYKARSHILAFMPNDNHKASLEAFNDVGKYLNVSQLQMEEGYRKIGKALSQWRKISKSYGLMDNEIKYFESAFEHEDFEKLMGKVETKTTKTLKP